MNFQQYGNIFRIYSLNVLIYLRLLTLHGPRLLAENAPLYLLQVCVATGTHVAAIGHLGQSKYYRAADQVRLMLRMDYGQRFI